MANYRLRLLLYCGRRWPLTEPRLRCRPSPSAVSRCQACRRKERRWLGSQRLTARPWPRCRRPPRPPAASWSTSPGCWRARPFLERQGVADRCALYPGDLFALPPAADLYLLASVLHDWDDDHAARIL